MAQITNGALVALAAHYQYTTSISPMQVSGKLRRFLELLLRSVTDATSRVK